MFSGKTNYSPEEMPDLTGRVYLVTGGTAGIGYQTVLHLIAHHAKVYIGARSREKAEKTIQEFREKYPEADLNHLQMDLMDLKTVKLAAEKFIEKETKLHGLINNAGIAVTPYQETVDDFEAQFQTNYLSHWLLTRILLPTLEKTANSDFSYMARVVNVSSEGHRFFAPASGINFGDINLSLPSISPWTRYGHSKLAGILHVVALNEKFGPQKQRSGDALTVGQVWTASVHPGSVDTGLLENATGFGVVLRYLQPILRFFGNYISSDQGSWTTLYAATSDKISATESGEYFVPFGKRGKASKHGTDKKMAMALWDLTETELGKRNLI